MPKMHDIYGKEKYLHLIANHREWKHVKETYVLRLIIARSMLESCWALWNELLDWIQSFRPCILHDTQSYTNV